MCIRDRLPSPELHASKGVCGKCGCHQLYGKNAKRDDYRIDVIPTKWGGIPSDPDRVQGPFVREEAARNRVGLGPKRRYRNPEQRDDPEKTQQDQEAVQDGSARFMHWFPPLADRPQRFAPLTPCRS